VFHGEEGQPGSYVMAGQPDDVAEAFGVYERDHEGLAMWQADFTTREEAEAFITEELMPRYATSLGTYDGTPIEVMIADRTNPWVEVDGARVDWTERVPWSRQPGNDCDSCWDSPVAGTIPAMDTEHGIQRCDECQRFEGDLDAALALANLTGGTVRYHIETEED
jgi:hypothetical protein